MSKMVHSRRELLTALSVLAVASSLAMPLRAAPGDGAQLAALARDVDRAESVRAVKRLQIAWAQYVDLGEWDRAAALFTQDAELAHGDNHFHGLADIRAYFQRQIGRGTVGLPEHMVHTPFLFAPIVTLSEDGNEAKGRWHAFSMRGKLGEDASWQGGIFECVYMRQGGTWKISRQIFSPMLLGPYETGWRPFKAELPLVPYHFQPQDIGKPFPLGPDIAAPATSASLPALAGRIQALRDDAEVRNLQNAYGYYVDWKMWDDVVDLFAPAGSVAISGIGTYHGPKGIRRSFERSGPAGLRWGEVNDHIQADLIVEVAADGMHARARGIQLGMIGRDNAKAWWTLTRFDNLFVKQGGKWRFDKMRKAMWMMTDYDKGWAKDWQSQPQPSEQFRPDGPAPATLPDIWQLERRPPAPRPLGKVSLAQAQGWLHATSGVDSIENLAGAYGQYLDDSHWEELASIFAEQGERDSAGGGFIRTPARIASFSRARYGSYNPHRTSTQMHMRNQPVIHVSEDGLTGQNRTRLFQVSVVPVGEDGKPASPRGGPMFITGMYEDDILFENGQWKIKRADIDHLIYAPYKTGWTQVPEGSGAGSAPAMGIVARTKFDAYNTGDMHSAFPRVPHMWFHYRNPVTGRVPPYLMPKYMLPEP
jgi:hypothetical protein